MNYILKFLQWIIILIFVITISLIIKECEKGIAFLSDVTINLYVFIFCMKQVVVTYFVNETEKERKRIKERIEKHKLANDMNSVQILENQLDMKTRESDKWEERNILLNNFIFIFTALSCLINITKYFIA